MSCPGRNMEDKPLNPLSLLAATAQPKQSAMAFEAPFKDETFPDDLDGGSKHGSYPAGIVVRPWAVRRLICPGCECISTDADSIIGHDNKFNCPALSQEWGYHEKLANYVDLQPVGDLCLRGLKGFLISDCCIVCCYATFY